MQLKPPPAQDSPRPALHPFTVRYLTQSSDGYEFACYARDKAHAFEQAKEMVGQIHDHPGCILWIVREPTDFDW
jgi:hypothetical protein